MKNNVDRDQLASDRLQKQSDLGLHCLSMYFWQATSVPSFRTITVHKQDVGYQG